jgi:plasmid stabilization system protein ParE
VKRSIIFRPLAEEEYLRAREFYEQALAGLGDDFEDEVEAVLNAISQQPDRYPLALRDVREAATRRFPYCIYYRARGSRIIVLAVFHQSRNPDEWQSRN